MNPQVQVIVQRDTRAWRVQVWCSFGIALALCASGLAWLPGHDIERAFMVMGYVFCLSSVFALSKYVRDRAQRQHETPLWGLVVWAGFATAMGLTGWGLWRMEINPAYKAYLMVSWLFLISAGFTLAKSLRDAHEADMAETRLADMAETRLADRAEARLAARGATPTSAGVSDPRTAAA